MTSIEAIMVTLIPTLNISLYVAITLKAVIQNKMFPPLSCEETCEKNISNYSKHSLMMTKAEYLIQRFQDQTAIIQ